jgi:hypothetical protein
MNAPATKVAGYDDAPHTYPHSIYVHGMLNVKALARLQVAPAAIVASSVAITV